MASVEEVCTHITLINKGRNVLTGSLDEIRRSHGAGLYEVEFRGERAALEKALAGIAAVMPSDGQERAAESLRLHIPHPADVRRAIAAVNAAVDIRSFREIIPGMNDIFIRTVQETTAENANTANAENATAASVPAAESETPNTPKP